MPTGLAAGSILMHHHHQPAGRLFFSHSSHSALPRAGTRIETGARLGMRQIQPAAAGDHSTPSQ